MVDALAICATSGVSEQALIPAHSMSLITNPLPGNTLVNVQRLPKRTHCSILEQIEKTAAKTAAKELCCEYRTNSLSIVFYCPSIRFPTSFPYNSMHLFWENLFPNLISIWTSDFKGFDKSDKGFYLSDAVWKAVGTAGVDACKTMPSAFRSKILNVSTKEVYSMSAKMWLFTTCTLAQYLLKSLFLLVMTSHVLHSFSLCYIRIPCILLYNFVSYLILLSVL
ncbi:hypothetical protein BDV98DRAFT_644656, partial [Pterulicium gracile]